MPNGAISFLSKCWGRNATDKPMTQNCGFQQFVEQGDLMLVDRGFDIEDDLGVFGRRLSRFHTVFSLKIRHSKVRHFQETSPNVFSLLTNFRFSNIPHITLIIRQTGCVIQHVVTMLLLVHPLESWCEMDVTTDYPSFSNRSFRLAGLMPRDRNVAHAKNMLFIHFIVFCT